MFMKKNKINIYILHHLGQVKLDLFYLPHTPKVTNVASQHFCLLIPKLTLFVALFS